jgi:hypothetical protein
VRSSKADILSRVHAIPELRFDDTSLTSSSGLLLFRLLFDRLELKDRLRSCFRHLTGWHGYGHVEIFLLLVVHILLGHRRLRELEYYRDDPMVLRVLGLRRLPDVSTITRRLRTIDVEACDRQRRLTRDLVLDRLASEHLKRVTIDFDGSVCSTRRLAEGTAVGYNRKRKGARSYYPLLCTVAQTSQVFDVLHRSGNVHDSHGSRDFIAECLQAVGARLPKATIETRLDGAFFSEGTVLLLREMEAQFTISVPFLRLAALKAMIESRQRWLRIDETWSYFEATWQPKSWAHPARFLFYRQQVSTQVKEPIQLDMFTPVSHGYEYSVIVTNQSANAADVLRFHHGRGSQEGIIGEIKAAAQIDYIPSGVWAGNRLYLQAGILAHNLSRELQMATRPRDRKVEPRRPALWVFERLSTMQAKVIRRAGRLYRPEGRLVLSMSVNEAVRKDFEHALEVLRPAA